MAVSGRIRYKPGRVKHLQKSHKARTEERQVPVPVDEGQDIQKWEWEEVLVLRNFPLPSSRALVPLGLATLLDYGEGHKRRA
jgi:hypothetical protein